MQPAPYKPPLNLRLRKAAAAGAFMLLSFSALVSGIGIAQAQLGTNNPPPPGGGSQAFNPVESLDEFLDLGALGDSSPPPPGGTRGNICALSPGTFGPVDLTWSDRPVFVWRGGAVQLYVQEYRPFNDSTNDPPIWTFDLTASSSSPDGLTYIVPYTGEPLSPGILYEWVLVNGEGDDIDEDSYIFEVIGGDQRAEVDLALAEISPEGLSPQALAQEQAQVFFGADLWSDAIKVLHDNDLLGEAFVTDVCVIEAEPEAESEPEAEAEADPELAE
ncbi:MAG: hypothetical protein WBA57_09995 [Elainellaceae cyanobacterium]